MLRLGGLMKGNMQQCIKELMESTLPEDFKLRQMRSLLRYLREVSGFVDHVKLDSGFEGDIAAYLEILVAKEDSDLVRRVSHTRVLRQDFDEKRREWRKQRNSVINAIGGMTARALRFEDKERKTIALYALEFYKVGWIDLDEQAFLKVGSFSDEVNRGVLNGTYCAVGENHFKELSKLWWTKNPSKYHGNHERVVYANVMGRDDSTTMREESTDGLIERYKRHRQEISKIPMHADNIVKMLKDIRKTVRASSKLQPGSTAFAEFLDEWWSSVVQFLQHSSIVDAEKNAREVMQTLKTLKCKQEENKKKEMTRLLSKLDAQAGLGPPVGRLSELWMESPYNPEETVTNEMEMLPITNDAPQSQGQQAHGTKMEWDSHSPNNALQQPNAMAHMKRKLVAGPGSMIAHAPITPAEDLTAGSNRNEGKRVPGVGGIAVSLDCDEVRSCRASIVSIGAGSSLSGISCTAWEEGSVCTTGTTGTDAGHGSLENDGRAVSGIPHGESDDDEDDDFEAADNFDLNAVDLCAAGADATGQVVYKDQEDVRLPPSVPSPKKQGVEQARFSTALDFFRQERQLRGRRSAMPPQPPSPICASPFHGKSPRSPLSVNKVNMHLGRKVGGVGVRIRPPPIAPRPQVEPGSRSVPAQERDRSGAKTNFAFDQQKKQGPGTLSLYIPRGQRTSTMKQRASKTPTAGIPRRQAPPKISPHGGGAGTSRATPRGVFFA